MSSTGKRRRAPIPTGVEERGKPTLSRLELAIVAGKSREVEGELGIMHDTRAQYARHARDI